MRSTSFLTALAAAGLAVGLAAVSAVPAAAASYGGYITSCTSSQKVTAKGTKSASGGITVSAPQRSITDTSGQAVIITVRGESRVGAWSVSGSGASAGSGYCS